MSVWNVIHERTYEAVQPVVIAYIDEPDFDPSVGDILVDRDGEFVEQHYKVTKRVFDLGEGDTIYSKVLVVTDAYQAKPKSLPGAPAEESTLVVGGEYTLTIDLTFEAGYSSDVKRWVRWPTWPRGMRFRAIRPDHGKHIIGLVAISSPNKKAEIDRDTFITPEHPEWSLLVDSLVYDPYNTKVPL